MKSTELKCTQYYDIFATIELVNFVENYVYKKHGMHAQARMTSDLIDIVHFQLPPSVKNHQLFVYLSDLGCTYLINVILKT